MTERASEIKEIQAFFEGFNAAVSSLTAAREKMRERLRDRVDTNQIRFPHEDTRDKLSEERNAFLCWLVGPGGLVGEAIEEWHKLSEKDKEMWIGNAKIAIACWNHHILQNIEKDAP